jgi:hypothetical protein
MHLLHCKNHECSYLITAVRCEQPDLDLFLTVPCRGFDIDDGFLSTFILILYKCLFFSRPDKMSRLTVIPGWMKIKIQPITELPESMLENVLNVSVP